MGRGNECYFEQIKFESSVRQVNGNFKDEIDLIILELRGQL
jgi:hypothetical protein